MKSTDKPIDQELRKAAKAIRDRIDKELYRPTFRFGSQPYSPFVQTGTMAPSFRLMPSPSVKIITNDYITEEKRRSRKKQEGFLPRIWRLLWDHNPWPYSPIEYYTVNQPAMIFNRVDNVIICHPALLSEIKKVMNKQMR